MIKLITRRLKTLLFLSLLVSSVSLAQLGNVDFLKGGAADGAKVIQTYMAPWANAFGAGLNGGWYNTAKPHKLLGFDITTSFNVGMVPTSAGTFNVADLGLTSLAGSGTASTISGPNKSGPTLTKTVSGVTVASFALPPGTNWRYIPVPTAQIGIGLPFGSELKFRYIPKINIKDGDISLWGVGLMHSIMQYIPGSKLLPLDVSIFGGYTKLEGNVHMALKPDAAVPNNITTPYTATSFNDQNLNMVVSALNVSAIASLNLPVVTLYGGLGYSKTSTAIALSGNFPLPVYAAAPAPPHAEYNNTGVIKGSDFGNMDIKNFSGIRANIGVRIKLAVVTIHVDYTRAQYNVVSAGLGISFR
jgi:hypothetical protein